MSSWAVADGGTPGESLGVLEVNAVSKWKASSETTVGLKGGVMRFASSASHEIEAKNACRFTHSMPSGPAPSLFAGFLLKSALSSDCASGLRYSGIERFAFRIWFIV